MNVITKSDWHPLLYSPQDNREEKPRTTGLTMVIDKGMGAGYFKDWLETNGAYIDLIKIGFGTSVLYPTDVLREKIKVAKEHSICILPGGTFLELAVKQRVIDDFFSAVQRMGFTGLEVSDGTIELSRSERDALINRGKNSGFRVFTEYGKKEVGSRIEQEHLAETIVMDISQGAELVTVEGRESGQNVGLFDASGNCDPEELQRLHEALPYKERLMWEAPLKSQQVSLIKTWGADIHLGNISPEDVLSVESLRRGLRSDTFRF